MNEQPLQPKKEGYLALKILKWGALPVAAGISAYLLTDLYFSEIKETSKMAIDLAYVREYAPKIKAITTIAATAMMTGLEFLVCGLSKK